MSASWNIGRVHPSVADDHWHTRTNDLIRSYEMYNYQTCTRGSGVAVGVGDMPGYPATTEAHRGCASVRRKE